MGYGSLKVTPLRLTEVYAKTSGVELLSAAVEFELGRVDGMNPPVKTPLMSDGWEG